MIQHDTISSAQKLAPKLAGVLARLCSRLGPLAKTKAVKLPYLVDVVAQRHLGRSISEGTHETWDYGVVTREVYRFITHHPSAPFDVSESPFSEGATQIACEASDLEEHLTPEELAIVDTVADLYGRLDVFSLGLLTKALNADLPAGAWGSNSRPAVDESVYARLSSDWPDLYFKLRNVDLSDRSAWGPSIDDSRAYARDLLDL